MKLVLPRNDVGIAQEEMKAGAVIIDICVGSVVSMVAVLTLGVA